MGEIADMVLEGTLDEETGEYIGEGPGWPRNARTGKGFIDEPACGTSLYVEVPANIKVVCPICKRRVKACGLEQHCEDKHNGAIIF